MGLLTAFGVAWWRGDLAGARWWIGNGFYLLVGVLPVVLWLALQRSRGIAEHAAAYATPLWAMLTALQGAVVGSVLGGGPIFLWLVTKLPVLLMRWRGATVDPSFPLALEVAATEMVVWSRLLVAVGAAVATALPLGLWAHYAGNE